MPEIYNPRDKSPIKLPPVESCPACGQPLPPKTKPMTNDMNQYISEQGNVVTINSAADTIDVGKETKVTMYRVDGTGSNGQPTSSIMSKAIAARQSKKEEPTKK